MNNSKATLAYLAQRLHEKSTYLMLPIIFGLYGIHVDDATVQAIGTIGISVGGLLLILLPEKGAQRTTTILSYLADRLREPITYTALPVILGLIGVHESAGALQQISQVGIGVGGLLAALLAERGTLPLPQATPSTDTTPSVSPPTSPTPPAAPTTQPGD